MRLEERETPGHEKKEKRDTPGHEMSWFDVCKSTLNVMLHVYRITNC